MDIEAIKRNGAIAELRTEIKNIQNAITHRAWEATEDAGHFVSLGKAMLAVEAHIRNMRELFKELQRIDPKNK